MSGGSEDLPRAFILDFDGVLLDSATIKVAAFGELFADDHPEHVPAIMALHERMTGISRYIQFDHIFSDILRRPLSAELRADLGRRFSDLVLDRVLSCEEIGGASAFLAAMSAHRPLFVASGTPQDELRHIVAARGWADHFQGVYGTPASKSDIAKGILEEHGLAPADVLFVGDAVTDYKAATDVGMRFVGVVADGRITPFPKGCPTVRDMAELLSSFTQVGALDRPFRVR